MKYWVLSIILLAIVVVGYYLLNPNFTKLTIITLDTSNPRDIVAKIQSDLYSTSKPIDEYATIRWGETGSYRNKDVAAAGVYLDSVNHDLVQDFNVTKMTLEKNGFVINSANTFGDLQKDTRQDVGYEKGNTICTVSISKNDRIPKYYLGLKCGTFDGKF